jgi:PadR family transcriptional regulator PadR
MDDIRLREFEELVLLAVMVTPDGATGAAIQDVLEAEAGRIVSLGAIYTSLDRLARKDLVASWLGEPTPVRGGRRKRHYRVTPLGRDHLTAVRRIRDRMWARVPPGLIRREVTP